MTVLQAGTANLAALGVDGGYVVVTPPPQTTIAGIDSAVGGLVGTGSWGPLNTPMSAGTAAEFVKNFGPPAVSSKDLATDAGVLFELGASRVVGVRVSDGTEAKATAISAQAAKGTVTIAGTIQVADIITITVAGTAIAYTVAAADTTVTLLAIAVANNLNLNSTFAATFFATSALGVVTITSKAITAATLTTAVTGSSPTTTSTASGATLTAGGATIGTLTALYHGTEGNSIIHQWIRGSNYTDAAPTWTLRIARAGAAPMSEIFPNIAEATLSADIATALANGLSTTRGPSELARWTDGAGSGAPITTEVTMTGGANGSTTITDALQLGSEVVVPSTGMYALEGQGVQHFLLCGNTSSATWSSGTTWAATIGAQFWMGVATGTTYLQAIQAKRAAGLDTMYGAMVKDWCGYQDKYNSVVRLLSPAIFAMGMKLGQSPEQSPGNKRISNILYTERTLAESKYNTAEIKALTEAGILFITNPVPGGIYFGLRHGQNCSSNSATNGLEHTAMTNFIAYSVDGALGRFIHMTQSTQPDDPTRTLAETTLTNFFTGLKKEGKIDTFSVDMSFGPGKVNTTETVGQGFMKAVVMVKYLAIVRFFIVTLVAGKTVNVQVAA